MPEWWSYTLSDFLLFSPRTYYRMLERYNEAVWPGHGLALAIGGFILVLLRNPSPRLGGFVAAMLGLLWAWIAAAFLWKRYSTINWAATYLAPLFLLQSLLLLRRGLPRYRWSFRFAKGLPAAGVALFVLSLVIYPALGPVLGRSWQQSEVFGVAPDPTAIGTIGLALASEGVRWDLLVIPLLWCLFSGLTLLAMGSPEAAVVLGVPLLVLGGLLWRVIARQRA
jgi:Family of unknown function (DUF6064)